MNGLDSSLTDRIEKQKETLRATGLPPRDIHVVVSPYRICPIGAHSDHQFGPVLGMAVSAYTLLTYAPARTSEVRIHSENYAEERIFDLTQPLESGLPDWARYARGAAYALRKALGPKLTGFTGRVYGTLPGGGLSSSASVILAYLMALADVNELDLGPQDLVSLALKAETEFVGVSVGILDPAAIVGSRRSHLLAIETRTSHWEPLRLGPTAPAYRILVVFTGTTRNLAGTGYNRRVEECLSAAQRLAELSGNEEASVLGDFDDSVFFELGGKLPDAERRRANHFFGERARVLRGKELWQKGDIEGFGHLMKESCHSSIHNYQTGSEELIELQRILVDTPGVYGARFSGAGFGGCSVALIAAEDADRTRGAVEQAFVTRFPHLAGRARAFLVESEDGARRL